MHEAISAARTESLAMVLRNARARLSEDEFSRLHAAFIVSGPCGSQWTVGLDDLNWYRAIDGLWVIHAAPDAVNIDVGVLQQIETLFEPDAPDFQTAGTVVRMPGHSANVNTVCIVPGGNRALSTGDDGTIRLWQLDKLEETTPLNGRHGEVLCAAFSLDGRYVFSGVWGAVCVWDLQQHCEVQRFGTPHEFVSSIAVSPDGRLLLSGGDERVVHVWEIATGREVSTLSGFCEAEVIQAVALAPDGVLAVTGGIISGVRTWDLANARELLSLGGVAVNCITFSPGGHEMAATGWSDDVVIYDPVTGAQAGSLEGHNGAVESVAYSADGRYIATGSQDCSVRVWDAGQRSEVARLDDHREIVRSVAFTHDGRVLAGGGGLVSADLEPLPGSDFDLRLWRWQ